VAVVALVIVSRLAPGAMTETLRSTWSLRKRLIRRCGGNRALAERLIWHETHKAPGIREREAIQRAIATVTRDKHGSRPAQASSDAPTVNLRMTPGQPSSR
jgi:hypothetical protein